MNKKTSEEPYSNRVYIAVFITGIFYILLFFWFTSTYNLP